MAELQEKDWRALVRTIQSGRCILVLGPDAAIDYTVDPHATLSRLLVGHLNDNLDAPEKLVDQHDLAHVAQLYYRETRDRVGLEMEVADFYAKYAEKTTPVHRNLAALPFSLCVTTTHDPFMENAYKEAGRSPLTEYYSFRKNRKSSLNQGRVGRPLVYKLYGHVKDGDSLVITETDLLDFLVKIIQKAPPVAPYIASSFADKDASFLFVGFGLQKWHLRILLHMLQVQDHKRRSLALEGDAFFTHCEHELTALFYRNELFLDFHNHSIAEFAARLRQEFQAQAAPLKPSLDLPEGAPIAFLCHYSKDRERVEELESELHGFGVDTWRDVQDLRDGDNWDRQIDRVLNKQVDYVLVLQTPEMTEKRESYFHKEIKIALDRNRKFAEGYRFIIPCLLEPCTGLQQLEGLHHADLSAPHGVKKLAESILEDWRRRSPSKERV